jgi:hypothetical protein
MNGQLALLDNATARATQFAQKFGEAETTALGLMPVATALKTMYATLAGNITDIGSYFTGVWFDIDQKLIPALQDYARAAHRQKVAAESAKNAVSTLASNLRGNLALVPATCIVTGRYLGTCNDTFDNPNDFPPLNGLPAIVSIYPDGRVTTKGSPEKDEVSRGTITVKPDGSVGDSLPSVKARFLNNFHDFYWTLDGGWMKENCHVTGTPN